MCKRSFRSVAIVWASLCLSACGYDNGPDVSDYSGVGATNGTIPTLDIDADATMTNIDPGQGVGMFVEYATGGTWTVAFTCDTAKTNLSCEWIIDAQTLDGSAISGVNVQALDANDSLTHPTPDVLDFDGITTTELDQFTFQATAGQPIGFDVLLQGEPNPNRYVFWIGDGGLNEGVTSLSFNLRPNPMQ